MQIKNLIKRQFERDIMSSEIEEATPRGDALVKYCPICGVEFDETVLTNRFFKCASCETIIQIKTKAGE